MYGFPTQLYPSPQGMFDDQSAGFGVGIDHEIFYSIKDGNWNDISLWETVSGRVGRLPTAQDDVYVRHNIFLNLAIDVNVKNLIIENFLAIERQSAINFSVHGVINCTGSISLDPSALGQVILYLYSNGNYIRKDGFICSQFGVIALAKLTGDQDIPDLNYYNLQLLNNSYKIIKNDLYVQGSLSNNNASLNYSLNLLRGFFDLNDFNVTVLGTSSFNFFLSKGNNVGYLLFGGLVSTFSDVHLTNYGINYHVNDFSGNPDIEFRGGINSTGYGELYTGTGVWTFSTNNQSISLYTNSSPGSQNMACSIIVDNIQLSFVSALATVVSAFILNNDLNGTNSTSTCICGVSTSIQYKYSLAPMRTGLLDCSSNTNTFKYNRAGNQDVKGTTYDTLELGGSGVKKLMGNVVVNTAYSLTGTATVDLNGFTLTHP